MSLPALAGTDDLAVRLNMEFTTDEEAQAEWLLSYASSRLRARTGRTWVDEDGELAGVPDLVNEICIEMVARAVTNPEGVTQDTTGPFSVSFGSDAAQRIYLTKQEREDLASMLGRPRLWTMSTTRGPIETPSVTIPPPSRLHF